jgi:hypothetical protein
MFLFCIIDLSSSSSNPFASFGTHPTVRNELEFATEGYNWRTVCTEEEMYIYYINNNNVDDYDSAAAIIAGGSTAAVAKSYELIHPVHFDLGEYTFGMGGQVIKLSSDRLCNC